MKVACRLEPVSAANWKEVIALNVGSHQSHLVGPNVKSLAEAYVRDSAVTFAIQNGSGVSIGFMMYLTEDFDEKRHIHRFMIDERWQGRGYGNLAMLQTINHIWYNESYTDDIMVMFLTYNTYAEKFYRKIGFENTGQIIIDEKLFRLPYDKKEEFVHNV